jgi:hypothetical protein
MKRLIIASLLVSATQVFAAPAVTAADNARLVNADASPLSAICIAAAQDSYLSAFKVAAHLGMTYSDLKQVYCNGIPLVHFVHTFRATQKQAG